MLLIGIPSSKRSSWGDLTSDAFSSHSRSSGTGFDQIGGFLPDAVGGHLGVAAVQFGHDADVGDAEVGRAAHAELGVDDGERVVGVAHGAGAGGVVACLARLV